MSRSTQKTTYDGEDWLTSQTRPSGNHARTRGGSAARLLSLASDYGGYAVGLAVAAALLPGVSGTLTGIALAAAMIALPSWLSGLALDRVGRERSLTTEDGVTGTGCAYVALMFANLLLLPLPLVVFAAAVVPGFAAPGVWNAIAATVISIVVQLAVFAPHVYFADRRRART